MPLVYERNCASECPTNTVTPEFQKSNQGKRRIIIKRTTESLIRPFLLGLQDELFGYLQTDEDVSAIIKRKMNIVFACSPITNGFLPSLKFGNFANLKSIYTWTISLSLQSDTSRVYQLSSTFSCYNSSLRILS